MACLSKAKGSHGSGKLLVCNVDQDSYPESPVLKPLVSTLQCCPSLAGGLVPHGNGLRNLSYVGSKQNRHPEALSRIRAHLEPGNDDVPCLSNESIIRKLPYSLGFVAPFLPQISITYSVMQRYELACCPVAKPQSTRESSASKRRTSSQ